MGCAIRFCNDFWGLGGPSSKPGGDILKKPVFLTYGEPSLGVLEQNQGYHRMRHSIMQRLLGVGESSSKPGRVIAKKTQNRFFGNKSPGISNWANPSAAPERCREGRVRWAPSRVRGATLVWKWGSCRASGVRGSIRPGSKLGRKVVGPRDLGAWAVRSQGNKT